jgi:NAD(P)-dependent dehydrogenase (short-subunit alcohol dehydrogenase family)
MDATRSAVVTGVTSGIGRATAARLLRERFLVFGSVRTAGDAERLASELPGLMPLVLDVTDRAAIARAAGQVRARLQGRTLTGLVNNAGIAVIGPLLDVPIERLEQQLAVNVVGPLAVVQAFAPLLGVDRSLAGPPGRILNLSSVSGLVALPFLGPYTASKFALEALSDTLRRELTVYGIRVVTITPGLVDTPFFDKTAHAAVLPPPGSLLRAPVDAFTREATGRRSAALTPDAVAETILKALTASRPKPRYVVVPSRVGDWMLPRLLPTRAADLLIEWWLGLRPRR